MSILNEYSTSGGVGSGVDEKNECRMSAKVGMHIDTRTYYGSRLLLPAKACAGAPLEDTNSSVRGFTKELVFVKQASEAVHACSRRTVEPCSTSPSRRSKLSESSVTPKLRN